MTIKELYELAVKNHCENAVVYVEADDGDYHFWDTKIEEENIFLDDKIITLSV